MIELRVPARAFIDGPGDPDQRLGEHLAAALGWAVDAVGDYRIVRRSIDARRRGDPVLLYRVEVARGTARLPDPNDEEHFLHQLTPRSPLPRSAVVVGTGPAGLMAAHLLSLYGCRPLVLDRGCDAQRRSEDVERFLAARTLDPESNYLYGEGGAGTFSDGKLYTRVRDPRAAFMLAALVAARAPANIRYRAHPHIGSDILPQVVARLRERIIAQGAEFRWRTRVSDIVVEDRRCVGVRTAAGEVIRAPCVMLATGHSDRALLRRLLAAGLSAEAKGYQLGCRIEHPQSLIDRALYGDPGLREVLGAAAYQLSARGSNTAGVTSFCMCPGGEVMPISTGAGLCTNGMSRYARAGAFANAALITAQPATGAAAFDRLDALEQAVAVAGGGDFAAPAQSAGAFLRGEDVTRLPASSYPLALRPARLDRLLDPATRDALRAALPVFARRLPGFIEHGLLIGMETRVCSPVRFVRDPLSGATSLPGLYVAGEAAGAAGGIVSAGIDGLRLAEAVLTGRIADRRGAGR